jgi:dTDP-glucose pyrophosphorylase
MLKKDIRKLTIESNKTIFDAINKLENNQKKFLIVTEKEKVIGTLTDGDVRRGTLAGHSLQESIENICNKKFIYGSDQETQIVNYKKLKSLGSYFLPVLNEDMVLVDVLYEEVSNSFSKADATPFILAGGFGKRLGSVTQDIPKPLVKVKNKTLIEYIIENLSINGFDDVFISLHHMSEQIIKYLGDGEKYGINIKYIIEDEPLGTFGSIKLLEGDFNNLLVINSDILTNFSLNKIVEYHVKEKNKVTLGVISYYLDVPFGVLDFNEEQFIEIIEKPKYKHYVNSGINVFSNDSLKTLDKMKGKIDLPDFINGITDKNKINKYEIKDYWVDVGTTESLAKAEKEW